MTSDSESIELVSCKVNFYLFESLVFYVMWNVQLDANHHDSNLKIKKEPKVKSRLWPFSISKVDCLSAPAITHVFFDKLFLGFFWVIPMRTMFYSHVIVVVMPVGRRSPSSASMIVQETLPARFQQDRQRHVSSHIKDKVVTRLMSQFKNTLTMWSSLRICCDVRR